MSASCEKCCSNQHSKRIAELERANEELEKLCDATYVAQGADAYNHACDAMVQWQKKRKKQGKEVGTTGSLCDGIAWLYERIEQLEHRVEEGKAKNAVLDDRELEDLARSSFEESMAFGVSLENFERLARKVRKALDGD